MLKLSALWEKHSQRKLSAILQVGDMGAFPDHNKLDPATKKHAKNDTDELGYRNFIHATEESRAFLALTDAPVLFVRGNHEDFEYLAKFVGPSTIDPFGRITFIPDGKIVRLALDETTAVRVGGFGGVAPTMETRGRGKNAREAFRKAQRAAQLDPRRFTEDDVQYAFTGERPDILLTHAGPRSQALLQGSRLLGALVERARPRVHLFGHHHQVVGPSDNGATLTAGLEHLEFDQDDLVRYGSFGIVEWSEEDVHFHFVTEVDHPWLEKLNARNYRTV